MKKIFLFSAIIFLFASYGYSAVTTIDGAITLDLYQDTQSGIENRWILDFTVNDYVGPGSADTSFNLIFSTISMYYDNQYNNLDTNYYNISPSSVIGPNGQIRPLPFPSIYTSSGDLRTPGGTTFSFYALPKNQGEPIMGNYEIILQWQRGIWSTETQNIQLTGPIGFAAVPEPAGMCLFALGAFVLKFLVKRK